MAYNEAFSVQQQVHEEVVEGRSHESPNPFRLLVLEHNPPVITISNRPDSKRHLLASEKQLQLEGIEVCRTNRGGDITYHGPGQLVGYPICDLNTLSLRIHGFMRFLEQVIIDVLGEFNIIGERDSCATGVWVRGAKVCAMGVRVSKWVSMHGFALNVTTNLDHFSHIVPCGLAGREVTSMQELLADACPSVDEVKRVVERIFTQAVKNQIAR
jgi:lipoate-protein ligase B